MTVEVVGHEVEEIQVFCGPAQIDIAQDRAGGRECGSEKIVFFWKIHTYCRKKCEEIRALEFICGILPHNCKNRQCLGRLE